MTVEADHWRGDGSAGAPAPLSGMGEVVRLSARVLHEAGHDVISAAPPTPALRTALEPYCSRFVDLHSSTRRSTLGRNVVPLWSILRRDRPDVVHFHVPHYRWALDSLIGAHAAVRTKVVRTEHNPMMHAPEQPYRALLRLADAAVDRFVYVSAGNRRRFEELMPWRRPGSVVANVMDPDRLRRTAPSSSPVAAAIAMRRSLPSGSRVAMFVAGSWQVDTTDGRRPIGPLIEAMAMLGPEWHLMVVGTGDAARGSALAARAGVGPRVHFLGPVPDASLLTASCDVLVSASHYEGLSVGYLEAWHAGVAVVSTPVDGIEDVVGDGAAAITAPHGDVATFAARWADVAEPSSDVCRVSREATETVRASFGPDRFRRELLGVYDEVLAATPAGVG